MTTYVRTMRQLHALPGLADVPDYSRILSRAEAVLSFGEKVVKAAESEGSVVLDDVALSLPNRLKTTRTTLGISRAEAAQRVGFSEAEIRLLEDAGVSSPFWKLDRYAQVLGLEGTSVGDAPDVVQSRFKESQLSPTGDRLSSTEATQLQKAVLEARWVGLMYVQLLTLRGRHPDMPRFSTDYGAADSKSKKPFQVGHELAKALRKQWQVANGPIVSMSGLCEQHGIPIVVVDLPSQFNSVLIALPKARVIAVSDRLVRTRVLSARVAIAHEIGHLHDPGTKLDVLRLERSELEHAAQIQYTNRDHVESRAGAFGAYLLAPQAQLRNYVEKIDKLGIAEIIAGVSSWWGMSFFAVRDHIWNNVRDVCPPDRASMLEGAHQGSQLLASHLEEFPGLNVKDLRVSRAGAFARLVRECLHAQLISRRSAQSMLALSDEGCVDDVLGALP